MFNFIDNRWYMITSAFSSDPWYALLMSVPFILFSILFLILLCGTGIVIYEEVNPKIEYRGRGQNLGGALIIFFTVFLIIPTIFCLPNMESVNLQPQFLPRIIDKQVKDNLKNIKENKNSAYLELQGHNISLNKEFIEFKKELLNNIPSNITLSQKEVSDNLQIHYIVCVESIKLPLYLKDASFNEIRDDIYTNNKFCAFKASEAVLADYKNKKFN